MPNKKTAKASQAFLRLSEIKSDTLILDNNTLCAIIAVSSINFSLKSAEEQNALIYGYQSFLNTLEFEVQILMQSRKMDIHAYLEKLKRLMEQQTNELLRIQTAEYIEFIAKLIESASIMNKNFYVIVPYNSGLINTQSTGFFSFLSGKDTKQVVAQKLKDFQEQKIKLDQRVNTVMNGLAALGLKSLQLKTEEIIELMYNSYNFDSGPSIDPSKLSEIKIKED